MFGVHGNDYPIRKPWCVSSCGGRILTILAAYQCDRSHQHEPAEGSQTKQTGFYTRQFASVIIEAWYPQKWFQHVPDLSTSSALVTSNLTKTQWSKDEKAIKAIKAEAEGLRANGTWDDSTVMPVTKLRKRARAKGEDTKIAEVLTLAGIKHHELSPEYHKYKGRIVYRGDVIKDQFNQHVFFTEAETTTTPAMFTALSLTLWFGCLTTISCADCIQAYLQCLLERNTWVILPFEQWLEEWKKIYDPAVRLAVKLIKSVASPSRKTIN